MEDDRKRSMGQWSVPGPMCLSGSNVLKWIEEGQFIAGSRCGITRGRLLAWPVLAFSSKIERFPAGWHCLTRIVPDDSYSE